jgi:SRSO17 transposase
MDRQRADESSQRFSAFLDEIASVIGHAARVGPMRDYCTGLLLSGERKSVEPIAAATAPAEASAQHQSLLHFLSQGEWSDAAVLGKVRDLVLPRIEQHGVIEAWVVDDTGFPKYGQHSVGVSHQYCGQVGKQTNCQIAVSLSLANHHASLPVAYQLYLPEKWASDPERRKKAENGAAADRMGVRNGPAPWRRSDGCRLWTRRIASKTPDGIGAYLFSRYSGQDAGRRHDAESGHCF